eukprot:TRINITY_DN4999_c0_g3_i1.p1 TRINITY_DN4999_c0_g3~~TRINITY_DN4999_c0_g3_i1.p1  ORF type:complete len:733 (+),score=153.89 TRINITY_DN4999_c0_g3_i1:87-2201(+)
MPHGRHGGGAAPQLPAKRPECRGPVQLLLNRISQEGDSDVVTAAKRAAVQFMLASGTLNVLGLTLLPIDWVALYVGCCITGSALVVLYAWSLATRTMPLLLIELTMAVVTFGVIAIDWFNASLPGNARVWQFIILIMDVQLLARTRAYAQNFCLTMITVWLAVDAVEQGYRLGLYDIDNWSSPPDDLLRERTDCAAPPCASGAENAVLVFLVYWTTTMVDFHATRGFALGEKRERDRVQASVRVAEQVAASLVLFDLEAAGAALSRAGDSLPGSLRLSLQSLLANLHSYRPYLPQSCFIQESDLGAADGSACDGFGEPSDEDSTPSSSLPRGSGTEACVGLGLGELRHGVARSETSAAQSEVASLVHAVRRTHIPHNKRISLLVVNSAGFLRHFAGFLRRDSASKSSALLGELAEWVAAEVDGFAASVSAHRGVVDLISADHLYASFGASLPLSTHRANGVACAARLTRVPAANASKGADGDTTAESRAPGPTASDSGPGPSGTFHSTNRVYHTSSVCSGPAVCGDFGSPSMQRFMVIGGLPVWAAVTERLATSWQVGLLLDDVTHGDVDSFWHCRLRKMVTFPKRGTEHPARLWEVLAERLISAEDEWMYALERASDNPWAEWNSAVSDWASDRSSQATQKLERLRCSDGVAAAVANAARALLRCITEGAVPVIETASEARAGEAIPVCPAPGDSPVPMVEPL